MKRKKQKFAFDDPVIDEWLCSCPQLDHWPNRPEPFAMANSEVLSWARTATPMREFLRRLILNNPPMTPPEDGYTFNSQRLAALLEVCPLLKDPSSVDVEAVIEWLWNQRIFCDWWFRIFMKTRCAIHSKLTHKWTGRNFDPSQPRARIAAHEKTTTGTLPEPKPQPAPPVRQKDAVPRTPLNPFGYAP